jgi:hypothetical protein
VIAELGFDQRMILSLPGMRSAPLESTGQVEPGFRQSEQASPIVGQAGASCQF